MQVRKATRAWTGAIPLKFVRCVVPQLPADRLQLAYSFGDVAPCKQKRPRRTVFNHLISLRRSGAGEGIRTLDPNLGKVASRSANENSATGFYVRQRRSSEDQRPMRRAGPHATSAKRLKSNGSAEKVARAARAPGLAGAPPAGATAADRGSRRIRRPSRGDRPRREHDQDPLLKRAPRHARCRTCSPPGARNPDHHRRLSPRPLLPPRMRWQKVTRPRSQPPGRRPGSVPWPMLVWRSSRQPPQWILPGGSGYGSKVLSVIAITVGARNLPDKPWYQDCFNRWRVGQSRHESRLRFLGSSRRQGSGLRPLGSSRDRESPSRPQPRKPGNPARSERQGDRPSPLPATGAG